MDTDRLRRELVSTLRLLVTGERRLFGGAIVGLLAYGLWVGTTGGALTYGADVADLSLTVDPWTGTTTAVLAVATVLWVVAPALLATYLLVGELTNVNGNIQQHYRVYYPSVLVLPFLAAAGLVVAVGVALGSFSGPLLGVLIALSFLVLVRTLVYSYRVFSFAVPRLAQAFAVVAFGVLAVTLLASSVTVAGRSELLTNLASGIDSLAGTTLVADLATGTTDVAGVAVPTLPGLAAGVPVGLAGVYLIVQILVGLVTRARGVTVPRSHLRTGQRYPEFARPTVDSDENPTTPRTTTTMSSQSATNASESTGQSDSGTASNDRASESEQPATADAATGDTDDEDEGVIEEESVSHTKVFTPPDDGGEFDVDLPESGAGGDATRNDGGGTGIERETPVISEGSGYECPSCADTFPEDTEFAYCPTCGSELEPQ